MFVFCSFEYSLFYGSVNFARECSRVGFGCKSAASEGLDASEVGCVGD